MPSWLSGITASLIKGNDIFKEKYNFVASDNIFITNCLTAVATALQIALEHKQIYGIR